jgi:hypothetical protein
VTSLLDITNAAVKGRQKNVPVLPCHEQAGPPFQQKYTAIWQKHTANSYFFFKSGIFQRINVIFPIVTLKT